MAEFTKSEWRAIIHFLFLKRKNSHGSDQSPEAHYGESAPDKSTVSRWISRFQSGRTSLKDDPRSGAPVTATREDQVATTSEFLEQDRRMTFEELEAATGYTRGTLHRMLHENLEMKKLRARWVPRLLTEDQFKD